jgi:hypothetical protein
MIHYIVTCWGIHTTKWWVLVWMIGFINSLVTHTLLITLKSHRQYITITDLYTFQFTVAHALGFSVSTSRLLAMDLHTETSTQITTSITLKIFQLRFQYRCTIAHEVFNSHCEPTASLLHKILSENRLLRTNSFPSCSFKSDSGVNVEINSTVASGHVMSCNISPLLVQYDIIAACRVAITSTCNIPPLLQYDVIVPAWNSVYLAGA